MTEFTLIAVGITAGFIIVGYLAGLVTQKIRYGNRIRELEFWKLKEERELVARTKEALQVNKENGIPVWYEQGGWIHYGERGNNEEPEEKNSAGGTFTFG